MTRRAARSNAAPANVALVLSLAAACAGAPSRSLAPSVARTELGVPAVVDAGARDATAPADGATLDAETTATLLDAGPARTDPMSLHKESRDELVALLVSPPGSSPERTTALLSRFFATDGPRHMNQGNKALALHQTSREECLAGLANVVVQTPEQRATCGAENMVPVWAKGKKPAVCIDVFEFPNRACELPIVWASPSASSAVCALEGKRLCTQGEWQLACQGDPEGGKDRRYAYGDVLDLEVCHTNRPHRQRCDTGDAQKAWATCTTDTEPSGSFPGCRSRFGVFDQHGNVAEVMTRIGDDGGRVSQLKGSAWFYTELAREPDRPIPACTRYKESAHSDHCNFDPRWHVEDLEAAVHVNYHLGFRCCKSL